MNAYTKDDVLLRAENISLRYGSNIVLRDLSVNIQDIHRPGFTQGQVVGFLGPSGVGKTQFFNILSGLKKPDTGQVLLSKEATPVQPGLVGVVPQSYTLFEFMTVIDILVTAARKGGIKGKKEAREKSMAMLERFGMADRARYFPVQLSGGQRQRISILEQRLCSDHFLLMDEPFSGLDCIMLGEVIKLIQEMSSVDELNTVIVVTHDVTAACLVSDTIWLMGLDRDEQGKFIPGAKIQKTIDLAEMGLAWEPDLAQRPEFHKLVDHIKYELFPLLK